MMISNSKVKMKKTDQENLAKVKAIIGHSGWLSPQKVGSKKGRPLKGLPNDYMISYVP